LFIDKSGLAKCLYCTENDWCCIGVGIGRLPPANRKQGLIPEEIYQTLLTNKKQGNLD
jgi:hypothetical protein